MTDLRKTFRDGGQGMDVLPKTFRDFVKMHSPIWEAHEKLARACAEAGPLNRKTRELIKIGMSVGAGLETAAKRHAVMARENGASIEEIYQTVLLGMTTCGHPTAVAGWQWVHQALTSEKPLRTKKKTKNA